MGESKTDIKGDKNTRILFWNYGMTLIKISRLLTFSGNATVYGNNEMRESGRMHINWEKCVTKFVGNSKWKMEFFLKDTRLECPYLKPKYLP